MSLRDHVGVVAPGLSFDRDAALVAAARSRGIETSVDGELRAARREFERLGESVPSPADARRRVAETEAALTERRERVATLRGRLQERSDDGLEPAYREAIRDLSEAETEHTAAREALETARENARSARDEREERLRLEDRVANLERRRRAELREATRPAVGEAVSAVPGAAASEYGTAAPVTAALALLRVGQVRTPVVLACRRFPDAASAESWLGTPVCRL